ncbi:MAG: IPT/TIG domain-containing protein [Nitrospira sp.]|nr:IPT/TIG domain-containing protein [Nitrospira sp.]MDH4249986.1 IPT/TIG domain-containing protein [Nitrospira sp.]MDH4343244.1 IPT/TIG domain-containing protein [Nitrospira sp.]MDH5336239.1 IPT/TIG domain-containing protein [Nitrospira sp.]
MNRVVITVLFLSCVIPVGGTISLSHAGKTGIELSTRSVTPGATLVLSGKGFGTFKSTQFNRVTVNGVSALVQRWDREVIEVKVPFKATSGFVEVLIGKKKLLAGFVNIEMPRIETITPTEAERGMTLQITGHHFGLSAGARDPNTMFGVNDVLVGGVVVRPKRWRDDKIELEIPTNAVSGDVVVRLASSDPLPDGSCCAPVEYAVSNAVPLTLIPSIRVDPVSGPVGTKVVLFGQGFGNTKELMDDAILIGGRPVTIDQWKDDIIVFHVPLDAESGPLVLKYQGRERVLAPFTVHVPRVISMSPASAPIGTLLRINGEHFGFYSEGGATPYNFMDFNTGENRVEIGGVSAVIYRWNDDRIDVWVPFSAKSGKVIIHRSANTPNIGGLCCAERGTLAIEAGDFTLVTPVIESYAPQAAGLDATVTIKGRGFGTFLKTAEHADLGLNQKAYKRRADVEINEPGESQNVISNVSRTEVLFNGAAALVQSWTDEEIVVKVPHRNLYGIGKKGEFYDNLATGPLVVRRGSWDLLLDGTCCSPKKWITLEAGPFTIEATGLPDTGYWNNNRPDASTNQ